MAMGRPKRRRNKSGLYKNKYVICLYDEDSLLRYMFDNLFELCETLGKDYYTACKGMGRKKIFVHSMLTCDVILFDAKYLDDLNTDEEGDLL